MSSGIVDLGCLPSRCHSVALVRVGLVPRAGDDRLGVGVPDRKKQGKLALERRARAIRSAKERQLGEPVFPNHRLKQAREALGVLDLVLHMVEPLENGEVAARVARRHGVAVLEVVFRAAELPERTALGFLLPVIAIPFPLGCSSKRLTNPLPKTTAISRNYL